MPRNLLSMFRTVVIKNPDTHAEGILLLVFTNSITLSHYGIKLQYIINRTDPIFIHHLLTCDYLIEAFRSSGSMLRKKIEWDKSGTAQIQQ